MTVAEDLIKNQCKDYTIFRFFNVGGGKPSNPEGLYAATIKACESGIFTIYGNDYNTKDGTGIRDYVHVSDLAKAHIDAIEYLLEKKEDITINLGAGKGHSVLDVINKV